MRVLIAFPMQQNALAEELDWQLCRLAQERQTRIDNSQVVLSGNWALRSLANESKSFTYCVIHDELPVDRHSSPRPGGGLQLAAKIRSSYPALPIALIHARENWTLAEWEQVHQLDVRLERNRGEGVIPLVERILNVAGPDVIDITIDLARQEYRIYGDQVPLAPAGMLQLSLPQLETFAYLSRDLEQDDKWRNALNVLSGGLRESLVDTQKAFCAALRPFLEDKDLVSRSRLHFHVHPDQYEVAFEAIRYPHDMSYWMLHVPVYRSFSGGATLPAAPIFERCSAHALDCLIILSAASGRCVYLDADGAVLDTTVYEDLKCAHAECAAVETLLKAKSPFIGEVVVVGRDKPLTERDLKAALASRQWDLVHYIGHTEYVREKGGPDCSQKDQAFFILPGTQPSTVEPLAIQDVVPHLRRARFVYFSSCQGMKFAFVRRLAEYGVPNVLGFRSRIRDDLALEHAKFFYGELLAKSSVERAFLATRQHFFQEHSKERVWACSSLVMQRC